MRDVVAVLVGASTSDVGEGQDSMTSAGDAVTTMTDFLRARFDGHLKLWPLCDGDATRAKLDDALTQASEAAKRRDLAVVLFSGHGDDRETGQAWGLYGSDVFEDHALAAAMRQFHASVEILIVSDCCYGEGIFEEGRQVSRAERRARKERNLTRLASYWSTLHERGDSAPHPALCAAGAYATRKKSNTATSLLTRLVCENAAPAITWSELADVVRADPMDGRRFAFSARPRSAYGREAFAAR